MERELAAERSNEDDFVYDIYYTNTEHFDFRLFEKDLILEALTADNVFVHDGDEEEFVYGDDNDDENAENNWRNDYPEEDPHLVDGNHSNYDYNDGKFCHFVFVMMECVICCQYLIEHIIFMHFVQIGKKHK